MGCERENLACGNPCKPAPKNTAAHETLGSEVDNFTKNFFGDVVTTETNGIVGWSLPCQLDVGLNGEPRGATEPLGCYFLRMFQNGITGPQGPIGKPGVNGRNGNSSYVLALQPFTVPPVNSTVNAVLSFNPSIIPGITLYDAVSGWYRILAINHVGGVTMRLEKPVVGSPSFIPSGTLFVLSGEPGLQGFTGVRGAQGPQGRPGSAGIGGITGLVGRNGRPLSVPFYGLAPGNHSNVIVNGWPYWSSQSGQIRVGNLTILGSGGNLAGTSWDPTFDSGGNLVFTGVMGSDAAHAGLIPGAILPQITLPNIGTYVVFAHYWYHFTVPSPFSGSHSYTWALIESRLFNTTTVSEIVGSRTQVSVHAQSQFSPATSIGVCSTTKVNDVVGIGSRIKDSNAASLDPHYADNFPVCLWNSVSLLAIQIA